MRTLICIGDSLTEGSDIPIGHAWPSLVANALQLTVTNHGIGGDTTQGMLSRFYAQVVDRKPAFVFLMGGTNDLWWGLEVNAILGNLFSIVYQSRHHGITPVIGLPLPVYTKAARQNDFSPPWQGYDQLEVKMNELVEMLKAHANESEIALIDLYAPFFDAHKKIREDLYLPDGLHPNRIGHLKIAEIIADGFQKQFMVHPGHR